MSDFYELFNKPQPTTPDNVITLPVKTHGDTPYSLKALEGEAGDVAAATEGTRNHTLNRAWYNMGRHVGAGNISEHTVREALTKAARTSGLTDKEIQATLRDDDTSGLAAGIANPRTPTPRPELPTVTILEPPAEQTIDDFWSSRDILTHIHTYARARCVAPWAVLGSVLARVICATPPSIAIPPIVGGYASLNLFVGLVGRSGSGKGAAESVAREAIDVGHIETRNTGSGEGAVHAYMKRTKDGIEMHNQAVLFSIPEIDTLGAVGARQGATLMPLLRSGWSGEQLGFAYADPAKNLLVEAHKYRMCIIAGIQPGRAGTLLDDTDGGTPQRFLWLPATDPHAPDMMPTAPEPRRVNLAAPITVGPRGLATIDVCRAAKDLIVSERRKSVRGEGDALDGHGLLTRLKVAAALGLLEQRREVNDEDWQLSGVIAGVSDYCRSAIIAHRQAEAAKQNEARAVAEANRQVIVGETVNEKAVARVARSLLRHIKETELAWHEARKRLASRDRIHFEEALDHLKKSGQVVAQGTENGIVLTATEETA